jgi:hypothetical protein
MSTRRQWACTFLGLVVLGYGAIFVLDLFGDTYPTVIGGNQVLNAGPLFELAPAILALTLIIALRRAARREILIALFVGWFALAALEAVAVHPSWGLAMALNGVLPLLFVLSELRARPDAA